jgi:hypothetical protein
MATTLLLPLTFFYLIGYQRFSDTCKMNALFVLQLPQRVYEALELQLSNVTVSFTIFLVVEITYLER